MRLASQTYMTGLKEMTGKLTAPSLHLTLKKPNKKRRLTGAVLDFNSDKRGLASFTLKRFLSLSGQTARLNPLKTIKRIK